MGRSNRGSASLARLVPGRAGVDYALPIAADCGQRSREPTPRRKVKTPAAMPPLHGIRVLAVEAEEGRESPEEGSS